MLARQSHDVLPSIAVVTGGCSGIGKEIVRSLAESGWHLAFNDLRDNPSSGETIEEIKKLGGDAFFHACDVSNNEQVDAFYKGVETHFGRPATLVVNNAGIQTWAPLMELKEADWDRVINTNLKGCFLNTQRAARSMIEHGVSGSIINIGSGCNQLAFPKLVDYSASKGGVEMFTKVSAIELGEHQIRVNCVAPGGILIDRTKEESPDYEKQWASISALGRVGLPKDIANAIMFLASEKASFITGQTLFVDGGVYAKANWPY